MSTAVYRMYDADDRLLYVGVSAQYPLRLAQHETKPWWHDVVRVTLTHFDHHGQALAAEGCAQEAEDPVHNVVRNGRIPNSRARREENRQRFAAHREAIERDRRERGVYSVSVRCGNCFHLIDELPLGIAKADADCPSCGVRLIDPNHRAA